MRKISKQFRVIVIIIVVFIIIYSFLTNLDCRHLVCLSLKNIDQYKIKKTYEDNRYSFRALYEKENILLRIEVRNNFSAQEAQQAIQSQITRTREIFEEAQAPYPGELSDIISCGKEFQPVYSTKVQNGIQIAYFSGFINDRLVFGSCAGDQAKYKDTLAMFYCPSQEKFYQLEAIIPNNNSSVSPDQYQEILDSIGCRK